MNKLGQRIRDKRFLALVGISSALLLLAVILVWLLNQSGLVALLGSQEQYRVETSNIEMGRFVQGKKISIRDQILMEKTAEYAIDGPLWPLGNERKSVTLSYLAELGYFPEDIIRSEKIDTFQGDLLVSRTLLIDLPLPDTLSFVQIQTAVKDQEWFWEGWIESKQVDERRAAFIDSLRVGVYAEFHQEYLFNRQLNTLEEATRTLLSYVNTGYQIGNDQGFSTIVARYEFDQEGATHRVQVQCQEFGDCQISRSVVDLKKSL